MKFINQKTSERYAIVGTVVHSTQCEAIDILTNHVIIINEGRIEFLGPATEAWEKKYNIPQTQILFLNSKQFIMPGFIDTHIHAPQYPNSGLGYDKTLLEWLEKYTFPLEMKYGDKAFAQNVYKRVVRHSLDCGTTTACYFATIHLNTSLSLVEIMNDLGQRGLVGKVNMNTSSYEGYNEEFEASVSETETFIQSVQKQKSKLILPVITPRFALSCDMKLMVKLGELAKKYGVHVQTHISENLGEIEAAKEQYPEAKNYADIYDRAHLLTNKTILAHGVHLEDEELTLIASRGTSISHCPCSNTNLVSGLCNVRRLLNAGINVGLGTDVAGGDTPSILEVLHRALDTSIHISFHDSKVNPLTYSEAFYLATLGGAKALSLDDQIGNFLIGKRFDALIIDMVSCGHLIEIQPTILVQKFVYSGDDRNIVGVFVDGNVVKNTNI